jgi:uncharacterized protein YyaL (SSP411 family)
MNPLSLLTGGGLWKIGAGALAIALTVCFLQLKLAEHGEASLHRQIDDPKTGLEVRLIQARTNVAQEKSALDAQNAAINAQSAHSLAALTTINAKLGVVEKQAAAERAAAAALATAPLNGADACSRSVSADKRLLESLP